MLAEAGSETAELSSAELRALVCDALGKLEKVKERKKVLILPPDHTRLHSRAGELTRMVYEYYGSYVADIMPALGTHKPMTDEQLSGMFGTYIPKSLFRVHDWRNDVVQVGEVPQSLVESASEGKVKEPWPAQLNKLVWEGGHDLVISIGQVVPHEVMGMANYNKNLFVGVGGPEAIHLSHFVGAVYGMERMMGRADNPLRKILDYATEHFLKGKLPVVYMHTVIANQGGELVTRGLYISEERDCFEKAAALSLRVNFQLLDEPIAKVVAFLDPDEFTSTWLGNKSIYRTRMAIADGGELIVLAPAVEKFGEDAEIDAVIREHGYRSTPEIMRFLENSRSLMRNLSAAAHLIHGTSEGRFKITYCPGKLSKEEVESVGYSYGDLDAMMKKYDPTQLKDGFNMVDGEKIFFVSKPALGLWGYKGRFDHGDDGAAAEGTTTAEGAAAKGGSKAAQGEGAAAVATKTIETTSEGTAAGAKAIEAAATRFSSSMDASKPSADAGIGGGPFQHSSGLEDESEKERQEDAKDAAEPAVKKQKTETSEHD
ncbi:Hypothetical Protein FCC1311_089892 [Hondaea fermentalgiana]|uniref:LarA-like N-terminal domain-containing protein n=1 Tax=Hondaea fermentalgiana TaxID=2315210 RepID=A0A2R5GXS1_9STRA|nr:Hypothetical Protein FCC1311_089892 [Hondaea fermentalgiana]|eukprot:GBG32764.1 Hypothetical Protein FCC1311_089892 [Hondaea fermentalgiana]